VKIYSSATGEVVSTLSGAHPYKADPQLARKDWHHPWNSDLITSAILNPHNHFQLITGSLNGCIMIWDFLDAVLLQVIDIEQPITHLCAHEKITDSVFVGATRTKSKTHIAGQSSRRSL
jgi:NET1-associated nuclear protein 1 (U3 small nucleolar RNA-associated protein 17)